MASLLGTRSACWVGRPSAASHASAACCLPCSWQALVAQLRQPLFSPLAAADPVEVSRWQRAALGQRPPTRWPRRYGTARFTTARPALGQRRRHAAGLLLLLAGPAGPATHLHCLAPCGLWRPVAAYAHLRTLKAERTRGSRTTRPAPPYSRRAHPSALRALTSAGACVRRPRTPCVVDSVRESPPPDKSRVSASKAPWSYASLPGRQRALLVAPRPTGQGTPKGGAGQANCELVRSCRFGWLPPDAVVVVAFRRFRRVCAFRFGRAFFDDEAHREARPRRYLLGITA